MLILFCDVVGGFMELGRFFACEGSWCGSGAEGGWVEAVGVFSCLRDRLGAGGGWL